MKISLTPATASEGSSMWTVVLLDDEAQRREPTRHGPTLTGHSPEQWRKWGFEIVSADPAPAADILFFHKTGGWLYKPISTKARELFIRLRYNTSANYPGWFPFSNLYGQEHPFWRQEGLIFAPDGAASTSQTDILRSDPDGPLVPLPPRTHPPHRYELLGYTPNKFGFHGGR